MTTVDECEQRKTAIHLLRSGCVPEKVAQELNRSISWVYKWQTRFEQQSWSGLQSRSRAPQRHGKRLPARVRQAVLQARSEVEAAVAAGTRLRYIGPDVVLACLREKKIEPLPSTASISRILRAAGMTKRRPKEAEEVVRYPHLHPTQPHQLVQVDIVPHFLTGGEAVACFNAIDVVSRYPTGQASARRRSQDAAEFLIHVWQEIGLPQYTQVDNESCFSGGFTHQGVLGKVLRLALFVGTELVFSPVRHPASNGTVERFHQDYDLHVWDHTTLKDRQDVAAHGVTFFQDFRQSRHHTALKGQTPSEVHHQSPPSQLDTDFSLPKGKLPLTVGRVHFIRKVSPKKTVSVLNLEWQVPDPKPCQGVWVTLDLTLQGATLHIYDAAPDAEDRKCLVSYPFPLKEQVKPKSDFAASEIEMINTLPEGDLAGLSPVVMMSANDVLPLPTLSPNGKTGSKTFSRNLILTSISDKVQAAVAFISTMY